MMSRRFLFKCVMIAAIFGTALNCVGQRVRADVAWPYYPNRPGAQAYMQGGAYAATTGSVTSMLFNPAGIAEMPGRIVALVEGGSMSDADYMPAYDVTTASQLLPLQFAGIAWQPKSKLTFGVFFARPTYYRLEIAPIPITTVEQPDGTGTSIEASLERAQISAGLAVAATFGKQFVVGGGIEWRRATVRDEIMRLVYGGNADALRFSFGMIMKAHDWNLGFAAQSRYKASGRSEFQSSPLVVRDPISGDERGNNRELRVVASGSPFSSNDPATVRFGIMTPYAFDRLRFQMDVEYKDFENDDPIEPWQFYGGMNLRLTSVALLSFGAFTFENDYPAFIDGPASETFLTMGVEVEMSRFRLSANFIDGDWLADDFKGQQFVNFALSYVMP